MTIDENVFFREVTLKICSSLDIRVAIKRTYEYIKSVFPLDIMYLNIHDENLGAIRFIAIEPENADPNIYVNKIIPMDREIWEKSKSLKTPTINDIDCTDPLYVKMANLTYNKGFSSLVIPLRVDDTKVGTLVLRAKGERIYNLSHKAFVSCLIEPFTIALSNALVHNDLLKMQDRLIDENKFLQSELTSKHTDDIIGSENGLKNVMDMVKQVAPRNNSVLLLGETGVGKEIIANAIHYSSSRRKGPFIKVNCGAIPESLIDTELFGYEKGAFTGAVSLKRGRFERADGGTIFLDEIGELPMHAQTRLLRILQNHKLERVGGTSSIPLDIRVIAATHRKLGEMVAHKQFREDLWFRINVFPIDIPPLRERREDIPELIRYFIEQKSREFGLHTTPQVEIGSLKKLVNYPWHGNVRELQNIIERELISYKGGKLSFNSLYTENQDNCLGNNSEEVFMPVDLDTYNAEYIKEILRFTSGKINGKGGAAEILGLKPSTLRSRMSKLNISRK